MTKYIVWVNGEMNEYSNKAQAERVAEWQEANGDRVTIEEVDD